MKKKSTLKTGRNEKKIFSKITAKLKIENIKKSKAFLIISGFIAFIILIGSLITSSETIRDRLKVVLKKVCPTHKNMVLIKSKSTKIGRSGQHSDDSPEREIHLDSYWIDRYEVTVAEYVRYCKQNNIDLPNDPAFKNIPDYFTNSRWANYPALNITWWEAKKYCECMGKRLPTEAEWERSARFWNNEHNLHPFTNSNGVPLGNYPDSSILIYYPNIKLVKNATNDKFPFTAPVGRFEPNGNRIYDMEGNVSEWCLDSYSENYYSILYPENPCNVDSMAKRAVVRGPSWGKWYDTVTQRNRLSKMAKSTQVGFRCAKSVKE